MAVAAAVLALTFAACGGDTEPGEGASAVPASLDARAGVGRQRLTVSNWDGYMPEDLPARFKAATGVP
ncbi:MULTISPECIES: hypothetical protein [unclassified Streptomyces]|uniref:hypothetical protein n=1 Tax=unclassified Streptomyces TaxID=2593676 RepID=UPI002DD88663|nr:MULTISPECIES: hypothetical protein [unclassified Streptomyces]WSC49270.1 hypothetical protein OIE61_38090 [Streptomyces sp. NBC_01762]WSC57343.1 hypothetical protein OG808_36680 [Streptomyces sp. NBC_01761]WSF88445.1 hypothetical protein OIE70_38225 [Streptomyces sp. NBC_01744]WSJ49059.1 hypothetical protein OG243_05440 [Streptomyces sp. NBC_01318]